MAETVITARARDRTMLRLLYRRRRHTHALYCTYQTRSPTSSRCLHTISMLTIRASIRVASICELAYINIICIFSVYQSVFSIPIHRSKAFRHRHKQTLVRIQAFSVIERVIALIAALAVGLRHLPAVKVEPLSVLLGRTVLVHGTRLGASPGDRNWGRDDEQQGRRPIEQERASKSGSSGLGDRKRT